MAGDYEVSDERKDALDIAEHELSEAEALIINIRHDILNLYALRGEDELTANTCRGIIEATNRYEFVV